MRGIFCTLVRDIFLWQTVENRQLHQLIRVNNLLVRYFFLLYLYYTVHALVCIWCLKLACSDLKLACADLRR